MRVQVGPRRVGGDGGEHLLHGWEVAGSARPNLDDVAPGAVLELVRRAGSDNAAVVDDHHLAGQTIRLLEVLRGEQDVGAIGDEFADGVPQLDAAARVEAGRRLVEQQQPRPPDEAGSEVEAATHPAGVRADQTVTGIAEVQTLEQVGGRRAGGSAVEPEESGDQLEVLESGHRRLDRCGLAGQTDHLADPPADRPLHRCRRFATRPRPGAAVWRRH